MQVLTAAFFRNVTLPSFCGSIQYFIIGSASLATQEVLRALPKTLLCALKSKQIRCGGGVVVMILLSLEASKAIPGSREATIYYEWLSANYSPRSDVPFGLIRLDGHGCSRYIIAKIYEQPANTI